MTGVTGQNNHLDAGQEPAPAPVPTTGGSGLTRRSFLGVGAGVAAAGTLAACGHGGSAKDVASAGAYTTDRAGFPELAWKGTITMRAQSYTPAAPGVKLAPGAPKLKALYQLAQQFTQHYPDITVKFLGQDFETGAGADFVALAAGAKLPDIWWEQFPDVNGHYPTGVATNLYPYLQQPNPYISGNKRWADVMNARVLSECQAGPTTQYLINGDYVPIAWFYNKSLFEKAGITSNPTTWAQLIATFKKLQAINVTPWAIEIPSSGGYDWLVRMFLGNALGEATLKQISDYDKKPGISTDDQAWAFHSGLIDPSKSPKVLGWWPQAKELFSYASRTISALPAKVATGAPTSLQLFASGKLGMTLNGSQIPVMAKQAGADFEIGSFPMPSLSGINQYATGYNASAAAGGPEGPLQWFMSTAKSDQSMSDPEKVKAVLNWLRFIATPTNVQKITNELGYYPPTFVGTKPTAALAPLSGFVNQSWYQLDGGEFFTAQGSSDVKNIYQQYVLGSLDLPGAQKRYSQTMQQAFQTYTQQHNLTFK